MTFGMLARCDRAGLGAQTYEIWSHLRPHRTLLLNLEDRGRGECSPSLYDVHGTTYQQVYPAEFAGALADRAVEWLCAEGLDVLFSVETFYDQNVLTAAHHAGIRTICHANPELAPWGVDPGMRPRPRELYVPTEWRVDTVPNAQVLPMPIARDRLPFRERSEVAHLYHVTGAAMLDRNGTNLLLAALPFVERQVRVTIRTEKPIDVQGCRCQVDVLTDTTETYWDAYPDDIDLLVMPRRYGGLSLVVQEAASLGIPSLMLQSDPYARYGFVHAIPTTRSRAHRMKGGAVDVFDADPRVLAQAIDWLVQHPDRQYAASHAADAWAEAHSWSGPLGDRWCELLSAECGEQERAA